MKIDITNPEIAEEVSLILNHKIRSNMSRDALNKVLSNNFTDEVALILLTDLRKMMDKSYKTLMEKK